MNELQAPINDFRKILLDETVDTGIDMLEVGLDSFLKDGILKDIPIIGTAYSAGKVYSTIKDITLTKKVFIFAQKVRKKTIDDEELKNYLDELRKDKKRTSKELEIILNYLDRHTKYTKSLILANFYILYLSRELEWEDFDFFAEIVDNISVYDLKVLKIVWDKTVIYEGERYNPISLQRLRNYGLVEYHDGVAVMQKGDNKSYIGRINEIGNYFCSYGMADVWDVVMNHDIIS